MNVYGYIILGAIFLELALKLTSSILNLSALRDDLPAEFEGIFDRETYAKSQRYTRERTKFSNIVTLFDVSLFVVFWFLGGFPYVNSIVVEISQSPIVRGLLFFAIIIVAKGIITLPFEIYSTFVIEQRYGFNRTSWKTFIMDHIKSLLIGALIGLPLLAGILWILGIATGWAWLVGWGLSIVFILLLQFLAPVWIMPLFNKFTPLEEGSLRQRILELAERADFPVAKIFVIDGSRRSSKANAFLTGFGKNRRIAFYDTLLEGSEEDELLAVLGHEIGHQKKGHIKRGMILTFLNIGLIFYLLHIFLTHDGLYSAFFMDSTPIYAGLLFFSYLISPLQTIIGVLVNMMSRHNEFEADAYSARFIDPEYLISGLKRLSRKNLSNLTPHPFHVFINYSHPPVLSRIEALRR